MEDIIKDKNMSEKFEQIIAKVPIFLQGIAREKVSKKIKSVLQKDNRDEATEKDLVDAFFAETPFGFHGPLKTDMLSIGVDYTKYGYGK